MLLRFITGTSLFVAVLTGALAAPVTRPGDATLKQRPRTVALRTDIAVPQSPDGDVTGSIIVPPTIVNPLDTLRQVIDAYESGNRSGGDTLARSLGDPASQALAEWIAIRNASRQVGLARINAFLAAYPSWPGNGLIRRRAEEALYNEGADAAAVRAFFATSRPETDEGKVALAAVLQGDGDTNGAAVLIRDAYRNDSLSGQLDGDIQRKYAALLLPADHKYRADRLIYDGNYDEGLRVAARAGAEVAALAKARIAVAQKARNAGALLAANVSSDPAYVFARVTYLRHQKKPRDAAALLIKAPRDAEALVRPDEWWTQRRLVARALLDQGDARTAYAVVSGFTAQSDTTRMEAEFHCGWIALRFLNDPRSASKHFAALSADAQRPISVSRGAYWQGRAAEAAGDKAAATGFYQAAARYPITYYGQIARARLGLRTLDLGTLPDATPAARQAFDDLPAIRAINQLYGLGKRDYARILITDMGKQLQDSQQLALLGQLALDNNDAKTALTVGKAATQRGLPLDAVAFPIGAIPGFESSGTVERAVVYGIARQESEFSHDVVSSAGARGLMQVMPSTAKATARLAGIAFDAKKLTSDPLYNARLGEAHLGELIGRFSGSYIMTFAAYNAGPGKVAEWVKAYGDPRDPKVDPIDWVERIPYTETRNYVQRVIENVQVYRARLDTGSALAIEADLRGKSR
ncbi:lytic transglycosylase domain-containing protein [Labrys neptuniae]